MNCCNVKGRSLWARSKAQLLYSKQAEQVKLAKETNLHCSILQLPMESILGISDQLPLYSRILFSQTCWPIRKTLVRSLGDAPARMVNEQRLNYIVAIARDMPRHWACEGCLSIHRIHPGSILRVPGHPSCPEGWHSIYQMRAFHVDFRRFQLTLKLARPGDHSLMSQAYLKVLLAPVHESSYPTIQGLIAQVSTYPKIIDGRLLMLTVWKYKCGTAKISTETVNPRQGPQARGYFNGYVPTGDVDDLWDAMKSAYPPATPALFCDISAAFYHQDIPVRACCASFFTDFSVHASSDLATLRIWHDLGTEGSPSSPPWTTRAVFHPEHEGLRIENPEPGSVRRLYELGGNK